MLRLRFTLPEGVGAENVSLRFAPLKYDKHFAFTFTCDDSYVNARSRIWSLIHAKWIDDREFNHPGAAPTSGYRPEHPLAMTDGCGNDRRFAFSCAIWPTWGNELNATFVKDLAATGVNSMYISWEELAQLTDFGVSMLYHNVDERVYGKDDPALIAKGLEADCDKVYEKLGVRLKVLGLPDGNEAYAEAARQSDRVCFMRNVHASATRIRLHRCGDLRKGETYGGTTTRSSSASSRSWRRRPHPKTPIGWGSPSIAAARITCGCWRRSTGSTARPAAIGCGWPRGTRFMNM